ncbi:relaxase MobL [Aerococcaceae bacterium NML160702]|nr:relaxase MobL [Aerococcaceae bacterium NML160702]
MSNTPSILLKSYFKIHTDHMTRNGYHLPLDYSFYIDYMERDDAKMERELDVGLEENKARYQLGERTLNYVGDPLKTNNVFNQHSLALSPTQIESIKQIFNIGQQNESPLWQTIFSFDNDFLRAQGFLTPSGTLHDTGIKEATVKSMELLIKQMGLNDTATWVGAIHYNTDNIHVHVALVEKETSRRKIQHGYYKGERQAKVPFSLLKQMKSYFANHLVHRDQELAKQSTLAKELLNTALKETDIFKEKYVKWDIEKLVTELPNNRRLWKYNMNAMQPHRQSIDSIIDRLLNQKSEALLSEYLKTVREEHIFRSNLYGDKGNQYMDNQLKKFNAALGNEFLRQLNKEFPKQTTQPKTKNYAFTHSIPVVSQQALKRIQHSLGKTKQDYLNQWKHQQLTREQLNQETYRDY